MKCISKACQSASCFSNHSSETPPLFSEVLSERCSSETFQRGDLTALQTPAEIHLFSTASCFYKFISVFTKIDSRLGTFTSHAGSLTYKVMGDSLSLHVAHTNTEMHGLYAEVNIQTGTQQKHVCEPWACRNPLDCPRYRGM